MITKYSLFTSSGSETLSQICRELGVSSFDIIRINDEDTSKKLNEYQMSGDKIPSGFVFKIPVVNTGSVETNTESYEIHSELGSLGSLTGAGGNSFAHSNLGSLYSGYEFRKNYHDLLKSKSSGTSILGKEFNCFVTVLLDGKSVSNPIPLPVFPQEFSDSNSANFSSQSILGRSVDYQIYQGSSRSVSFTLSLHEELCSDYKDIHTVVSYIESACYPGYSEGIVLVPEIIFVIGNQFSIRGILESCSATWKPPIIDDMLVNCDLSVSVKETSGPYGNTDIRSKGGFR